MVRIFFLRRIMAECFPNIPSEDESHSGSEESSLLGDFDDDLDSNEESVHGIEPYMFEPVGPVDRQETGQVASAQGPDNREGDPQPPEDPDVVANWYVKVYLVSIMCKYVVLNSSNFANLALRCRCGKCVRMPTQMECVCCRNIHEVSLKLQEVSPPVPACITDHQGFPSVCLNRWVLQAAANQLYQDHGRNAARGPVHKLAICYSSYL